MRDPSGLCRNVEHRIDNTDRDNRGLRSQIRHTCLQYIPYLFRPLGRVDLRSPKFSFSAECIVTFPEPPVEAYVPPLGFRDTDHAIGVKQDTSDNSFIDKT